MIIIIIMIILMMMLFMMIFMMMMVISGECDYTDDHYSHLVGAAFRETYTAQYHKKI